MTDVYDIADEIARQHTLKLVAAMEKNDPELFIGLLRNAILEGMSQTIANLKKLTEEETS